jgi:hypothetical protein
MSIATGEFLKEKVNYIPKFNRKRIDLYFSVLKPWFTDLCFTQTGLVLGVYNTDDDAERFKLTSAAQKLNKKTNGALLDHIKL